MGVSPLRVGSEANGRTFGGPSLRIAIYACRLQMPVDCQIQSSLPHRGSTKSGEIVDLIDTLRSTVGVDGPTGPSIDWGIMPL